MGIPVSGGAWPQAPVTRSNGLEGATGASAPGTTAQAPSFTSYLKQAIDDVNALQVEADAASRSMLAGDVSDIHRVVIASEKASLAMHLAIEVRNKVIEAYQEIMRMQV
ncbi:MAG: flagellar hook-basal body complex protein FliE [Firmicutes bacterium]|nr:flagellar hook-basal body complex protein FliE [Bacillota bacterium]